VAFHLSLFCGRLSCRRFVLSYKRSMLCTDLRHVGLATPLPGSTADAKSFPRLRSTKGLREILSARHNPAGAAPTFLGKPVSSFAAASALGPRNVACADRGQPEGGALGVGHPQQLSDGVGPEPAGTSFLDNLVDLLGGNGSADQAAPLFESEVQIAVPRIEVACRGFKVDRPIVGIGQAAMAPADDLGDLV
jgi:hypothetical protein